MKINPAIIPVVNVVDLGKATILTMGGVSDGLESWRRPAPHQK
jgi:hypothetical protein